MQKNSRQRRKKDKYTYTLDLFALCIVQNANVSVRESFCVTYPFQIGKESGQIKQTTRIHNRKKKSFILKWQKLEFV